MRVVRQSLRMHGGGRWFAPQNETISRLIGFRCNLDPGRKSRERNPDYAAFGGASSFAVTFPGTLFPVGTTAAGPATNEPGASCFTTAS